MAPGEPHTLPVPQEILPGRGFTFWQWFDGVLDLTKRCLKSYWSDRWVPRGLRGRCRASAGECRCHPRALAPAHAPSARASRLIIGFISKQYVCKLLSTAPDGTFLLRFSDSEIGGVTIAHVIRGQDGEMGRGGRCRLRGGGVAVARGASGVLGTGRWSPALRLPPGSSQVENIQPFSAKDLSIRSLGDRIRDLGQLRNLYPNVPKDQAFGSHYNSEWAGAGAGAGPRGCGEKPGGVRGGAAGPRAGRGGRCRRRGLAPCWGGGSRTLLPSEQKSRRARTAGATSPPPSR